MQLLLFNVLKTHGASFARSSMEIAGSTDVIVVVSLISKKKHLHYYYAFNCCKNLFFLCQRYVHSDSCKVSVDENEEISDFTPTKIM